MDERGEIRPADQLCTPLVRNSSIPLARGAVRQINFADNHWQDPLPVAGMVKVTQAEGVLFGLSESAVDVVSTSALQLRDDGACRRYHNQVKSLRETRKSELQNHQPVVG